MANYQKTTAIQGSWVKSSEIENGTTAKIVSETNPQPSQYLNKDGSPKNQDVAKVLFKGYSESVNVGLNRTTINGLIDSFGEDSKNWQDKVLTVDVEKIRIGGKSNTAIYLIPENYEKTDDDSGYAVIRKIGEGLPTESKEENIPVINEDEEIDPKDIPF